MPMKILINRNGHLEATAEDAADNYQLGKLATRLQEASCVNVGRGLRQLTVDPQALLKLAADGK